jgi:hypothetical protein
MGQPDRVAAARDKLLAARLRRFRERIDKPGKAVAPKTYPRTGATINRYIATLSHVFTMAMKRVESARSKLRSRNLPAMSLSAPDRQGSRRLHFDATPSHSGNSSPHCRITRNLQRLRAGAASRLDALARRCLILRSLSLGAQGSRVLYPANVTGVEV